MLCWVWCPTPLITVPGRPWHADHYEFEASLIYRERVLGQSRLPCLRGEKKIWVMKQGRDQNPDL